MQIMRSKSLFLFLALCLILCPLVGCGTTVKSPTEAAYKTLLSAQIAYDKTMTAAAEAYAQGKITIQQKEKIIALGHEFKRYYLVAVDGLILGSSDQGVIAKATAALDILMNFAGPLLGKKGG